MKKTTKALLSAVFALILMLAAALPAFANVPVMEIDLRIEGKDGVLFYDKVSTNNEINFSIKGMLTLADAKNESLTIKGLDIGYITAINDESIGQTEGGQDIFVIRVNGEYVPYSQLSTYPLKSGDRVLVYYSDEFDRGFIFPMVDTSKLESQRYIRFIYEKASPDGSSFSNESIIGATVTWYCDEASFTYVTDGQGGIIIDKNAFTSGKHKIQIELDYEDGTPALLRFAPDFYVEVPVGIGDTFAVFIYAAIALISLAAVITLTLSLKKKRS